MFAVEVLDPTVQCILFVIAIVLLTIHAFNLVKTTVNLGALGLAVFIVPFAWNAASAA